MNHLKMRADAFVLDVLQFRREKVRIKVDLSYKVSPYQIRGNVPSASGMQPLTDNRWRGEAHDHIWLKATFEVPELSEYESAAFCLGATDTNTFNPQFLVYRDGQIVCAFDCNHRRLNLEGAGKYEIFVYAYCNSEKSFDMELQSYVLITDINTERLYYDLVEPLHILDYTPEISKIYADMIGAINHAISLVDMRDIYSDDYEQSVEAAIKYINETLYGKPSESYGTVVGIGHTHIDIAWLWRYKQTREKAVHSFATVLNLMDQYPDYKFMSSQAILYKIVKEEAPELYERIKQRIKEGRWEVEGAMWLEADCNLTSGESLVRQILVGKKFFKDEFGIDSKILWLPDVFGYSAALPQILRKSGVDTFVTSKISWNDTNQVPYDTFSWKGIDGTEVFSYFLTPQDKVLDGKPVRYTTYTGNTEPAMIAGTWERYQQKNVNDEALLTFGYGDGGGGPTIDMLEKLARTNKGLPNCPKSKNETATSFIKHLKANAEASGRLPQISGELYLEFHRGTYTSVAKVKRANRKAEFALQNAEWLSVLAENLCGVEYPKRELDDCWEIVLTNQFHDILPGSSIPDVYKDTDVSYAQVNEVVGAITDKAIQSLVSTICGDKEYVIFNPHSFVADAVVERADGNSVLIKNVPAKGWVISNLEEESSQCVVSENTIENAYFIIELNENGDISRLYDKVRCREVLDPNKCGNVLEVHEDIPPVYVDNWDIKAYHGEKVWKTKLIKKEVVRKGNKNGIRLYKKFSKSTICQTIWVYDGVARIDFETEADWHNEHVCLKTDFPLDLNAKRAVYNIQFGNIERPTTRNNSWEEAKFEVCGQKFVDVSESDYGVSLLNDCKYGHELYGADIRLTLLRTPTYPNSEGECGKHVFTYSLYLHDGALSEDTVKQAYLLNNPLIICNKSCATQERVLPGDYSLFTISDDRVVAETVKKAEAGKGYVVRMYESTNARVNVSMVLAEQVKSVWECDLLENKSCELKLDDDKVNFTVKPYEIKTLLIETL